MATSPVIDADLVSFTIFSNGNEIKPAIEVISIEVKLEANAADEAIITILDGNLAREAFEVTDSKTFRLGTNIEIKLGYHTKNDSVFKGVVTQQKIIVNSSGNSLQVRCKNLIQEAEQIRPQVIDITQAPVLEVTFGLDIIETELDIDSNDTNTINGYVMFQGSARAMVNDMINIKGIGSRFSNNVAIIGVLHSVKEGNWITTVSTGMPINS